MGLDALFMTEVIEVMENFLAKDRPPKEMRDELDITYEIEGQSIFVFEVRPRWNQPDKYQKTPIIRTTWQKSKKRWKIYWMPSDLRWHGYEPKMYIKNLNEFIDVLRKDEHGAFWG